jgi:L-amino acid N-acyltransferase YncA
VSDGAAAAPAAVLRPCAAADIPAITAIYAHYVRTSLATFDEVAPSEAEMSRRHGELAAARLPFLVAVDHRDVPLGFAFATYFRPRSAYRFTLEDSIYVAPEVTRRGIGGALLARLIELCAAQGFRQMMAMIGDSGNAASIGLHSQAGFTRAGLLPGVGFKLGRWIDCVVMQRALGPGSTLPPC